MRVALVHDYLTHFGGAERVLKALMDLFPNAPVYTLVYNENQFGAQIDKRRLRPSFLQKIPGAQKSHKYMPLALMPLAVEQFDLSQYDVVLSNSHSFSKGVITGPNTLHMCYCYTPTRYAWDDSHRYVREFSSSSLFQKLAPLALSYIRLWDYYAAQRVDKYLTSSKFVAKRISKYYGRESIVIPPPVEVDNFAVSGSDDGYYLIVSRLVPYKRIDLAIDACERLGVSLKIVGTGPDDELLRERAGKMTSFLGFVSDDDLPMIYRGAKALLFPQEEDFGITPLEAAASGKPTIAYASGGALETIVDGKTGLFIREQTVSGIMEAIAQFERTSWDKAMIRSHAEKFDGEVFLKRIFNEVNKQWTNFNEAEV